MDGSNGGGGSSHSREYCLRWNNHQPNMVSYLSTLLPKESFADVTLVSAEGTKIQAHKIILSACSPYFEGVFEGNPCKHPVVILKDVQYVDLRAIVSFIYNGEVNIEVNRINEIIQTATALQVKGLAEVPADEFKRVSLAGRCSSPADNSSPVPMTRTQAPPPLIMSSSAASARSWPSAAEPSESMNDFPVRKKLKKSASANIPFSSGSSSTNGDATNSTGSSFESGVGTSVSRSVDEGIGSDISSNDQPQSGARPGPPPLTAANALLPKSRSLDDGYQRNKVNNADGAMESGGYGDHHGMDDNGLGQDGGYNDIDVEEGNHLGSYGEDEEVGDEDDPAVDMTYYEEDQVDYEQEYGQGGAGGNDVSPNVPIIRKIISTKGKINRNNNNNNNNNNNANRQMVGVGHSLSLYRQQQQPFKNFTSRALIGKRRRGRPLLRQPRIKRIDNESSPGGGGRDEGVNVGGGGCEEHGYSSDTGEPYIITPTTTPTPSSSSTITASPRPSSSSCYDTQQQQHHHHQARSASVEHEPSYSRRSSTPTPTITSTSTIQSSKSNTNRAHSPSPGPSMKPSVSVPIVRVSQCSPTPPGSPQHENMSISSPKSERGTPTPEQQHQHQTLQLQKQSSLPCSGSGSGSGTGSLSSSTSSSTALLTVPSVQEPCSSNNSLRLHLHHPSSSHLVKQASTPLPLSHHLHYHSSEDEGGPSPSPSPLGGGRERERSGSGSHHNHNPVIRRQHSQPVQSSMQRAYPSYSIVGRGQLFHILKSDQFVKDEESSMSTSTTTASGVGGYHFMETPMFQLVPASQSQSQSQSSSSLEGHSHSGRDRSESFNRDLPVSFTKSQGHGESISITLKEVGTRSLSTEGPICERPTLAQQSHSMSISREREDPLGTSSSSLSTMQGSEGQVVHRSGHCPALRPGPALGCNFCWNSVDSCGRVLRRKTKYFCPECHINLCIVPCFQEYHEKSDRKKKPRSKLGLPKPSSM